MQRDTNRRRVKSVDSSCEILRAIQERGTITVSELSEAVGLSVGTVHTHLATLKDHGFVVQRGTTYRLGPQLVPLGEYVKHHSELFQAAQPELDKFVEETGECVHLLIENNGQSIFLYEAFGENAVGEEYHTSSRIVPSGYLHYYAAGKAILSHLSASRVNEIIDDHGLQSVTDETITDRETLLDELMTIRSQGYAVNDEEELRGIRAVGAPVLDDEDRPLGAISMSAPKSRLQGTDFRDEIPSRMMSVANIIEVNYQTGEMWNDRNGRKL